MTGDAATDLQNFSTTDEEPDEEPRIHAYASGPSGVHAVPLEAALEVYHGGEDAEGDRIVWIDLVNPQAPEADFLRDELGFHPLAVEDCMRGRQRPKVDRYAGYFFMVVYAAGINDRRGRMALSEVHVFLGPRYVVTVHDRKIREIGEVVARWRTTPGRFSEVGALAHALMDSVVDGYFPVLDHFSERVEQIESAMADDTGGDLMADVLGVRRELTLFRKVVAPERELLTRLLRRDLPFLGTELIPYFQDVNDHVMRVTEEIDSMRELLSAAVDAHLSAASNRLNQTMRVMAAWSIILMAMAWIAGIYGMNFEIMPELGWRYGYVWALGAMVLLGIGLLVFFRRRRWI